MSEINVTPFVDVMLVLLVIFMVTAPMMVQGLDVNLPDVAAAPLPTSESQIILTLKRDQRVFLGENEIPLERLRDVLTKNAKIQQDKELVLHADKSLTHGFVTQVMALAREGGATKINIVTDPLQENG